MDDKLLDKLVQKNVNIIDEVQDLNLLVRRLPVSAEALSRMNERVDATQVAVQAMEKSLLGAAQDLAAVNTNISTIQKSVEVLQTGVGELPVKLSIPMAEITALRTSLDVLSLQLTVPLKQDVAHHHHLAKSSWLNIVFLTVIIALCFFLFRSCENNADERENAIKYRSLRLSTDTNLEKLLESVDSTYQEDPAAFRKITEDGEREQKEKFRNSEDATRGRVGK